MQFYLERDGQTYGPYTFDQLRQFQGEGRFGPNDLLRPLNENQSYPWQSVLTQQPAAPVIYQPQPQYNIGQQVGPMPPDMEWWHVALISFFCGLFGIYWIFKQLNFVERIDPANNSKKLIILGIFLFFGAYAVALLSFLLAAGTRGMGIALIAFTPMMFIGAMVCMIIATFNMRKSIQHYYTFVEPMGVNLMDTTGTILTIFFPVYFFQYHFFQIATIKKSRGHR